MGADIHIFLETKYKDKWVFCGEVHGAISNRWYTFFAEVAEVRGRTGTSLAPRGIPEDCSDFIKMIVQDKLDAKKDIGYHSYTHLTIDELHRAYLRAKREDAHWWADEEFGTRTPAEFFETHITDWGVRSLFNVDYSDNSDEEIDEIRRNSRVVIYFDS